MLFGNSIQLKWKKKKKNLKNLKNNNLREGIVIVCSSCCILCYIFCIFNIHVILGWICLYLGIQYTSLFRHFVFFLFYFILSSFISPIYHFRENYYSLLPDYLQANIFLGHHLNDMKCFGYSSWTEVN